MSTDTRTPLRSERDDRADIRDIIENWVIWRDTGVWDRLRTLWHADGRMTASWTTSTADEFIERARGRKTNNVSTHFLGGQTIDLNGDRALSQTKMTISTRGTIDDIPCDVVCTGRFYDFLEYRDGRWAITLRRCIYDKDRADAIDAAQPLRIDRARLAEFPPGYQHLAYLQTQQGYQVSRDLPGSSGPALEELYAAGAAWLGGAPAP